MAAWINVCIEQCCGTCIQGCCEAFCTWFPHGAETFCLPLFGENLENLCLAMLGKL